jgi:recombination protein RecA
MYNEGISKEGEIIALGEKMGIISKSGSSYKYGDTPLGRGYDATRQFLKDKANKKMAEEILGKIRKQLHDNGGSVVPTKGGSSDEESSSEE